MFLFKGLYFVELDQVHPYSKGLGMGVGIVGVVFEGF